MKQILNQRYIYKINSSYLVRNKWNIQIDDVQQAIKNRFIVSIGDSNGTRIIRNITNTNEIKSEESINIIKQNIKSLRKRYKSCNAEEKDVISKNIKILNEKYYKLCLEENICNVVFSSNKQYQYVCNNGFHINGDKYVILLGTAGGIKANTVMCCKEEIHDELLKYIYNGFDKSIPMIPSKLMAYMSLVFSSSTPVTNTKNILVVQDVETTFKAPVTYIEFNEDKGEPDVIPIESKDILVNACDGCGIITPELMKQWGEDLQLDYTPTSVCVRNSWVKGMLTKFDFKQYCKEVLKEEWVYDVWNEKHNINDIDVILNESMLKCWKGYKSIDEYNNNCNKYGHEFAITKSTPKELENERTLNYQYIQCLNLSDNDIENLIRKDINNIKDVLGLDYRKTILFSKGTDLNDKNVWNKDTDDDLYAKALMINGDILSDDYIKHRIRNLISKKIKQLKTGKINVEGNYQVAIGEPIIQLENMFGLEPKGILGEGEFWISYWNDRYVDRVASFRSPMSCKSNARIMNICNKPEVVKWYGDIKNVIMFNAWDTTMMAMNGEDFDGDLNFTTSNEILINGIYDEPAIDCKGNSSEKKPNITRADFIDAIGKSFGNKVGSVTNVGSACYDKLALFEEGSEEYKELDKRIKCIQFYQQECIDSAKNGKPPKPIPSHWNDFRSDLVKINVSKETDEILDDDNILKQKEFNRRILTDKKPYYFIYIYDETKREYDEFIKKTNASSVRKFRLTVEELYAKEYKTKQEQEFLEWYEKKIPVSNNACVVNKIANIVENNFDRFPTVTNKSFDYTIYQSDNKDIGTKEQIKELKNIFKEYKKIKQDGVFTKMNNEDRYWNINDIDSSLISSCVITIPDKQILLNTLIELSYSKSYIAKWMTWLVCGNTILDNMLNNHGFKITYPIKDNDNGIIEYSGFNFSMCEKEIMEVDIDG